MKSVLEAPFRLCFCFLLILCLCLNPYSVDAQTFLITSDVDIKSNQKSLDAKSFDDLLGPDTNFPFNPANHRDSSNPIKRIGKISDENL